MNIIDSHQHFWKYKPERYPWISGKMPALKKDFSPADLKPIYKVHGISGCVAVQAVQDEEENHFLLDLAASHSFIFGVVGWIDLQSPDLRERLNAYLPFQKLKGFRHVLQDEADPDFILRPDFQKGLEAIFEAGYSYDLLVYPHQLKGAIKTVKNFPEAAFVLDHIAKPDVRSNRLGEWEDLMEELAGSSSVFCKLSGMVTEADWDSWHVEDFFPYLDVVIEAFGEDRVMYGSDWPVCLLAADYGQVKDILDKYLEDYPDETKAKIWGGNAAGFYRLSPEING
ncbi:amidohydrolase family protein [Negadavirga shengliensis]|uniref:Amidohydrolase family protein n=1 Tax=Negadavirga shengliensis TaxID=1389218 RepID=A0ABV9SZ83_9BACT